MTSAITVRCPWNGRTDGWTACKAQRNHARFCERWISSGTRRPSTTHFPRVRHEPETSLWNGGRRPERLHRGGASDGGRDGWADRIGGGRLFIRSQKFAHDGQAIVS